MNPFNDRTTAARSPAWAWAAAVAAMLALVGCGAGGAVTGSTNPAPSPPPAPELVVFLVRHAEAHHEPGGDPALTADGTRRAERLGAALRDAGIEVVHVSQYRRTGDTAMPLVRALGLEPVPYDARDLPALAARLRAAPGRHLVVGHSNTTNEVVELLGGTPGTPIDDTEHDRLYVVFLEPDGARTILLRY